MSIGRHATLVTVANVGGQALQLAALPLISQHAPPATFGLYTLFVGACALFSVVAGLRYDAAIVVALHDNQAARVARLVLVLSMGTAVATFAIGWPTLRYLGLFDATHAAFLAALAATYLLGNAALRIATNWLTRMTRFGWVGLVQFTAVGLTVCLQLGLLALGVDPTLALASGFAIGQAGAAAVAFAVAAPGQRWIGRGRRRDLATVATRFINFPRYMILYGLNSALRERLVHAVIGWGAGAAALGQFAMVQRVVGAPHAFMHGGIGPALLSHARHVSRAEAARLAASLIELSCLALTPVMLFLAFNADALAAALFGAAWAGLGAYVPWLAGAYLVLACTGFIDRLFELYGQQRVALRLDLAFSVVMLGGLVLSAASAHGLVMAAAFGAIYLVYEIYWTWRAHRANELPLQALRRAAVVFACQLVFWALVCWMLQELDSLAARAAVTTLLVLVVFAGHHRWLGGREVVRRLFGKPAALA